MMITIVEGGIEMNDVTKGMLLILLIIYIISPADLCPGPVDDIILLLIAISGNRISQENE